MSNNEENKSDDWSSDSEDDDRDDRDDVGKGDEDRGSEDKSKDKDKDKDKGDDKKTTATGRFQPLMSVVPSDSSRGGPSGGVGGGGGGGKPWSSSQYSSRDRLTLVPGPALETLAQRRFSREPRPILSDEARKEAEAIAAAAAASEMMEPTTRVTFNVIVAAKDVGKNGVVSIRGNIDHLNNWGPSGIRFTQSPFCADHWFTTIVLPFQCNQKTQRGFLFEFKSVSPLCSHQSNPIQSNPIQSNPIQSNPIQ